MYWRKLIFWWLLHNTGYFGGGRIPIARGQKWLCFGHLSRGSSLVDFLKNEIVGFDENLAAVLWCDNVWCCNNPRSVCVQTALGNVNMVAYGKINSRLSPPGCRTSERCRSPPYRSPSSGSFPSMDPHSWSARSRRRVSATPSRRPLYLKTTIRYLLSVYSFLNRSNTAGWLLLY